VQRHHEHDGRLRALALGPDKRPRRWRPRRSARR